MQIKGREGINIERDGYIYIFQKDFNQIKLQEDEKGDIAVDVSDIFKNAKKWKWGIYTDKYYSALLSAFAFKIPRLVINAPNALISIKKDKEFVSINALIFAKDKDLAFEYANQFRKANREYVAFEFAPDYHENLMSVKEEDIHLLLSDIVQEIKEIKETTSRLERRTNALSFDTQFIKEYMERFEDKFKLLQDNITKLQKDVKDIKEKIEPEKTQKDVVIVNKIKDEGVYSQDGEKIYLDIVGSVFDYLDIDKSFYSTFRVRNIDDKLKHRLKQLIKEKYFKDDKYITGEELKSIGFKGIDETKKWRISFVIKERTLKEAVSIFSSVLPASKEEMEKAFKEMLKEAVKSKKEISVSDIEKRLSEKSKKVFNKLREKFKGKKVDIEGNLFVYANNDVEKLMLFAIVLDAERNKRKVVIK